MTPANYGSVFSCCLFSSLMMLYLYVFCRSKRFILRNGTFVIYLAVGVVMIRMLLPWNFHFAANVESHKILPFLFDLLRVKILSVEFLTILVIIFCFGSCLRLALYFYKLVRYRHLLHQLDPLDDIRILRIFSDILEEYHCTKQILIYQVPGLLVLQFLVWSIQWSFFLTENTVIRICVLFLCMNSIIIYTMTYGRFFSGNSLYVSTGGILFLIWFAVWSKILRNMQMISDLPKTEMNLQEQIIC